MVGCNALEVDSRRLVCDCCRKVSPLPHRHAEDEDAGDDKFPRTLFSVSVCETWAISQSFRQSQVFDTQAMPILGRLTLVPWQVDETPGIALAKQLVDVTSSTWKEGWNVGLRRGRALVRGGGVIQPFGAIGIALEGVRGGLQRFYSGLSFSVVNQIPSNVIYLVAYQKAKEMVEVNLPWLGKTEEGSPWPPLIASVVTEVGPALKVES